MAKTKLVINPLDGELELINTGGNSTGGKVTYFRDCNVYANTYLKLDGEVSNLCGYRVNSSNLNISEIYVKHKKDTEFNFELFEHDGNEVNLISIGSYTVNNLSQEFNVNIPLNEDKQVAAKITTVSGIRPKDVKIELIIEG